LSLYAEQLSEHDVAAAAETWVRYVAADARPKANIEKIEPYLFGGQIAAYIVHFEGGGFCFCGADDLLEPVYLYNPRGIYYPEIPDYQTILQKMATRRMRLMELSRQPDPGIEEKLALRKRQWQSLIEGYVSGKMTESSQVAPTIMSLNFTAMWHSGSGPRDPNKYDTFNKMCPVLTPFERRDPNWGLTDDEHCTLGCTATAISQIMYYWQWPDYGEGANSIKYTYRWWPEGGSSKTFVDVDPNQCTIKTGHLYPLQGRLAWDGNFLLMQGYWDESLCDWTKAKATYGWSEEDKTKLGDALDILWNSAPNESEDKYEEHFDAAIYRWDLMVDQWDPCLPQEVNDAMRLICYHAGVAITSGYGLTASGSGTEKTRAGLVNHMRYDSDAVLAPADSALMREEIQWLRPLVLRGTKPEGGGHYWVVYGYDTGTNQFEMNMGWGEGSNDVWCTLSDPCDYSNDQQHITRIAPPNVKFVGAANAGDGSPDNPYENIEEALAEAPDDSKLIFKAGSVNTFAANILKINRPLTLKGYNVSIRKQ
jgi:hypothetical protein